MKTKHIYILSLFAICIGVTCKKNKPTDTDTKEKDKTIKASFLIKNGTVYDGTDSNPITTDIAIKNDTIVFMGNSSTVDLTADETIDAKGYIITPGFIDPHTHCESDLSSIDQTLRRNLIFLRQGVTTVLTGNDGYGTINTGKQLSDWQEAGIGTNVGLFVGFGSVRKEVLGSDNVQPNATQLAQMKSIVAKAMSEGAFGLSTGLSYIPQSYSLRSGTEVKELAKATKPYNGVYDTHLRNQGSGILNAIKEVEEISDYGGSLKVHISHIKVGPIKNYPLVDNIIAQINAARSRGMDMTANVYPYLASADGLRILIPSAYRANSTVYKSAYDNATAKASMYNNVRNALIDIGETVEEGAKLIVVVENYASWKNKSLWELSQEQGKDPMNTALDMLYQHWGIAIHTYGQSEDVMKKFLAQSYIVTGSDGSRTHPRGAGTFPEAIKHYSVDEGVQTLKQAIRTSSGLTAEIFGIKKRGILKVGNYADIVVLDLPNYKANATYEEPEIYATGVKYVFLNGRMVVKDDTYQGILAGRGLKKR